MNFKSLLLFCCTLTVFSACEQSDMFDDVTQNGNHEQYDESKCYDFNVDMKTAAYTAGFLDTTSIVNIEPIALDGDTIMYVANYKEGWKLLSADMRATPILVSSPTGSFCYESQTTGSHLWIQNIASNIIELRKNKSGISYDELDQNQDYQFWKQMYLSAHAEKISSAPDSVKTSRRKARRSNYTIHKYLCKRLVSSKIVENKTGLLNKRLETKWNQDPPYNKYLPLVKNENNIDVYPPAGCTAVAMGQLLYWAHYNLGTPLGLWHGAKFEGKYPNSYKYVPGIYHPNSDRWDDMNDDYYYVAEFLAELSYKLGMRFEADGSDAEPKVSVMNEYGLTWDEGVFTPNTVINNLKNGLPVLITAYSEPNKSLGHAWIIDGLKEQNITTYFEYEWVIEEVIEGNIKDSDPNLCHPLPPMEHHEISSEDDWVSREAEDWTYYGEIHNSYDELRRSFIEVKDYDVAIGQGLRAGKREYQSSTTTKYYFMMNWGWDTELNHDNEVEYAADNVCVWTGEQKVWQYYPRIYYNIRKK